MVDDWSLQIAVVLR